MFILNPGSHFRAQVILTIKENTWLFLDLVKNKHLKTSCEHINLHTKWIVCCMKSENKNKWIDRIIFEHFSALSLLES